MLPSLTIVNRSNKIELTFDLQNRTSWDRHGQASVLLTFKLKFIHQLILLVSHSQLKHASNETLLWMNCGIGV